MDTPSRRSGSRDAAPATLTPRRALRAAASAAAILGASLVPLVVAEGATRLYAGVFGNPAEVRHGLATRHDWPDPGISSSEFHGLVDDQYSDLGGYYAYAEFPEPARITWTDLPVHINEFGLRGPEFALNKTPGVFRVVTMGESSTFGFMVDDADTYPVRLQEILDRRLGGGTAEVINAGLPYYTTEDMSILLNRLVADMAPNLVTFYIGYNDATWLTRTLLERRMRGRAGPILGRALDVRTFLLDRSLFLTKVARRTATPLRNFIIADDGFATLDAQEARGLLDAVVAEFSRRVSALHAQACARGIDHVFVLQLHAPLNMWTGTMGRDDDPFEFLAPEAAGGDYYAYASAMRRKLDRDGFDKPVEVFWSAHHEINEWLLGQPALRPLDFVARVDGELSHLATLIHLNPTGNAALARFLADSLQDAIARRDTAMIRARCDEP